MSNIGYIKSFRTILDWRWFTNKNTLQLFIFCIHKANFKDVDWENITIERGSFVTSLRNLALATDQTIGQIRFAIKNLIETGEIKVETNNKFTKIIVLNYSKYQDSESINDYNKQNAQLSDCNTTVNNEESEAYNKPTANEIQTNYKQTTNQLQTNNKPTANELQQYKKDNNNNNINNINKEKKDNKDQECQEKNLVEQARQVEKNTTEVIEIFKHWQEIMEHPNAKLDDKRKKIIRQALKTGYSVEELKDAITGCSFTSHNVGGNTQGQRYDGLHIILRSADQIDRFVNNCYNPPKPVTKADELHMHNKFAAAEWVASRRDKP